MVEIFDMTGKMVYTNRVSDNSIVINIFHLPAGMYYLRIDGIIIKVIKINQ